MWSSRNPTDPAQPPTDDVADIGLDNAGADPPRGRPLLTRNQGVPPPAPAPPQSTAAGDPMTVQQATDSLSLIQLRRLVQDMRQAEPVAYDFTYTDTGQHGEEIDEWFVYMVWQWIRLNGIQRTFEWQWQEEFGAKSVWAEVDEEAKRKFMGDAVEGLKAGDISERLTHISKIAYVVLGRWGDTAVSTIGDEKRRCAASAPQLAAIKDGVKLLTALDGHGAVWQALRNCFEVFWFVLACTGVYLRAADPHQERFGVVTADRAADGSGRALESHDDTLRVDTDHP